MRARATGPVLFLCVVLSAVSTVVASAQTWKLVEKTDPITDSVQREAVARSESGATLRVYRAQSKAVVAELALPSGSPALANPQSVLFRVDKQDARTLEPIAVFESKLFVELYPAADGAVVVDGPAREMMDGSRLIVRTSLQQAAQRDDWFSLDGALAAISKVTGSPAKIDDSDRITVHLKRAERREIQRAIIDSELVCQRQPGDRYDFCELALAKCRDEHKENNHELAACLNAAAGQFSTQP